MLGKCSRWQEIIIWKSIPSFELYQKLVLAGISYLKYEVYPQTVNWGGGGGQYFQNYKDLVS